VNSWRRFRSTALGLVLVMAAGCTGAHSRSTPAGSPTPEMSGPSSARVHGLFYAAIDARDGAIEAVSVRTGKVVRQVAPAQRDGMARLV